MSNAKRETPVDFWKKKIEEALPARTSWQRKASWKPKEGAWFSSKSITGLRQSREKDEAKNGFKDGDQLMLLICLLLVLSEQRWLSFASAGCAVGRNLGPRTRVPRGSARQHTSFLNIHHSRTFQFAWQFPVHFLYRHAAHFI